MIVEDIKEYYCWAGNEEIWVKEHPLNFYPGQTSLDFILVYEGEEVARITDVETIGGGYPEPSKTADWDWDWMRIEDKEKVLSLLRKL